VTPCSDGSTLHLRKMDLPGPPREPQPTPAMQESILVSGDSCATTRRLTTHIYGPKLEMSNVHNHPSSILVMLTYWLLLTAVNSLSCRNRIRYVDTEGRDVLRELTDYVRVLPRIMRTEALTVIIDCYIVCLFRSSSTVWKSRDGSWDNELRMRIFGWSGRSL
jgi:hypothetical protein